MLHCTSTGRLGLKSLRTLLVATLLGGALTLGLGAEAKTDADPGAKAKAKAAAKAKPVQRGRLSHLVAFKFKPEATAAQIAEVETAFAALPRKISEIVSMEWGTNISPEKLDKGFTHGFVLTFRNAKDRDAYLVHPDHQAFGALVGPLLADVFVLDFAAQK